MKIVEFNETKHAKNDGINEDNNNLNDWSIKVQLNKKFRINKNTCPKEESVMYSSKGRKVKLFNKVIKLKGLFRLPNYVSVEMNSGKKTTKLNKHMFPKTLFMNREAKAARAYLCKSCPIVNCSYKIK